MDLSSFHASSNVTIAASPEVVFAFISDMTRMGEVSPECTGGVWESDDRGAGAIFIGSNTAGDRTWRRRIRIVSSISPSEFVFENLSDAAVPPSPEDSAVARWSYTFTPVEGGTYVEEAWEFVDHPFLESFGEDRMRARQATNQTGIEETLASLKELLERDA